MYRSKRRIKSKLNFMKKKDRKIFIFSYTSYINVYVMKYKNV